MSEPTPPTPEPMTPKQLTEIRERAAWVAETGVAAQEADQLVLRDVPALLAEVQRLRSELDDQRTLYGTAKAIAEQATKWHTDARAELAETTHVLAVTGEKLAAVRGQRDRAETDRDTARAAQERLIAEVKDERRRRAEYVRQVEAERDAARLGMEKLREALVAADKEATGLRAEVKRLRAALGIEVRRNSGGHTVPSGAPDSVVRSWAREHNIPTNPKGRVAPDVRSAYEAAWRAEQDGGDPC